MEDMKMHKSNAVRYMLMDACNELKVTLPQQKTVANLRQALRDAGYNPKLLEFDEVLLHYQQLVLAEPGLGASHVVGTPMQLRKKLVDEYRKKKKLPVPSPLADKTKVGNATPAPATPTPSATPTVPTTRRKLSDMKHYGKVKFLVLFSLWSIGIAAFALSFLIPTREVINVTPGWSFKVAWWIPWVMRAPLITIALVRTHKLLLKLSKGLLIATLLPTSMGWALVVFAAGMIHWIAKGTVVPKEAPVVGGALIIAYLMGIWFSLGMSVLFTRAQSEVAKGFYAVLFALTVIGLLATTFAAIWFNWFSVMPYTWVWLKTFFTALSG